MDRQNYLFWTEVRPMFATVRDVRRFGNVVAGALRLVGDEVDITDLLALEALRLLEPELFEAIIECRDLLTRGPSPLEADLSSLYADENEAAAARIREIVAIPNRLEDTEQLLRRLFPHCARHLGGESYPEATVSQWRVKRLVADPEVFNTYLYRRLPLGTLPAPEVERVVRALGDEQQLKEIFAGMDDDQLKRLFGRLVHYETRFTPAVAVPAINAILHREGRQTEGFEELGGWLLTYRLLRGLEPAEVRDALVEISFPDLTSRYDVVRMVGYHEGGEDRMVAKSEAERLEEALVDDVLATSAEELVEEADLGPLIFLTRRLRPEALAEKLSIWAGDDRFFVRMLTSHHVTVVGGQPESRRVQLLWPRVVETFGVATLRRRLGQIPTDWVTEHHDADAVALWEQARRYLDDPEAGERDSAPYMGSEPPREDRE
jgi:hypothetical protein